MTEEPSQYIDFTARYKTWISIKKMSIRKDTETAEIAFHLSGIRNAFDKKLFSLLNINTDILDEYAEKAISKKKDYNSLINSLKLLNNKEIINKACDKKVKKVAEIYLLNKIIINSGFNTIITQELISKLYPELKLKVPKGLGRSKKKK